MWDTAWTYYQKLGVSDEFDHPPTALPRRQRRGVPHLRRPGGPARTCRPRDNFLLGYGWFTKAVYLVDKGAERPSSPPHREDRARRVEYVRPGRAAQGAPRRPPLPLDARRQPDPLRLLAGEGQRPRDLEPTFGERARSEWIRAKNCLAVAFGDHPFPAHNDPTLMMLPGADHVTPSMEPARTRLAEGSPRATQALRQPGLLDGPVVGHDPLPLLEGPRRRRVGPSTESSARKLFYEGIKATKAADFPLAVRKFKEGLDTWAGRSWSDHPQSTGMTT